MEHLNWSGLALAILAATPITAWGMWLFRPQHHPEGE